MTFGVQKRMLPFERGDLCRIKRIRRESLPSVNKNLNGLGNNLIEWSNKQGESIPLDSGCANGPFQDQSVMTGNRIAVVIMPARDQREASLQIKRQRRLVGFGYFKKGADCAALRRLGQKILQKPAPDAPLPRRRTHGDSQQFCLAGNDAAKGETVRCRAKEALRRGEQIGKLRRRPRARCAEASAVNGCQIFRRHGSSTGGASRDGAASAGRRYKGAGRADGAPRPAAIRAIASASGRVGAAHLAASWSAMF